jgi:hypothetical protein
MTSRSGTPTTLNTARKRPMVTLSLSPEAISKLETLAKKRGTSKSGLVERLILAAR